MRESCTQLETELNVDFEFPFLRYSILPDICANLPRQEFEGESPQGEMGEETLQQLLEKLQGAQDRTAAAAAVTLVDDIRELLHKQLKTITPEMGNHATEPTCVGAIKEIT